jgi:sigma-B regulation protein RsbU (phosphoserine phosphatase)
MNSFITFFFCEINVETGELRYVNAGHNPPLVLDDSGQFSDLQSSGFALGMFPGASFESGLIYLKNEDIAVLFTDGIPEGRNTAKEDYSEERLKSLIIGHRDLQADQLSAKIFEDLETFAAGTEQADDITLVIIKRK